MPQSASEWAAYSAVVVTLLIAAISGFWAVRVRAQENERAEWRRIQELTRIVYEGQTHGVWAQKLAVDELLTLARRRTEIIQFLNQAQRWFFNLRTPQAVDLGGHISDRLRKLNAPSYLGDEDQI